MEHRVSRQEYTGIINKYQEIAAPIKGNPQKQDLYFVFRKSEQNGKVFLLDFVDFKDKWSK